MLMTVLRAFARPKQGSFETSYLLSALCVDRRRKGRDTQSWDGHGYPGRPLFPFPSFFRTPNGALRVWARPVGSRGRSAPSTFDRTLGQLERLQRMRLVRSSTVRQVRLARHVMPHVRALPLRASDTALGFIRHKGTWKPFPLTQVEPSISAFLEAPLLPLAEAQGAALSAGAYERGSFLAIGTGLGITPIAFRAASRTSSIRPRTRNFASNEET